MEIPAKVLRFWFVALAGSAFVFVVVLGRLEKLAVNDELNYRGRWLVERLKDPTVSATPAALSATLKKLAVETNVAAVFLCSATDATIASYQKPGTVAQCASKKPQLNPQTPLHRFRGDALPAQAAGSYVAIYQDPATASAHHGALTRTYALLVFVLILLVTSALTAWVHRLTATKPIRRVLKALLRADRNEILRIFRHPEIAPLVKNIDEVLLGVRERPHPEPAYNAHYWTPTRLRDEVKRLFGDQPLCVIANREPYIHNRKGKKIETVFPASGLVTAVEPAVRACSGLWIGHGSGSADRETSDERGLLMVPPGKPEYALKRVWLTKEEEEGYYYGFSNEGLWPLCHIAHNRPIFRIGDFNHYERVNQKFADAFVDEMKQPKPIALIQDYHFALLPEMIRKVRPDAVTSLFWHIPWPNPEAIEICPWREKLLMGMLGADLIGFHIQYHCNNFLDTVDRLLEARVDRENFSVTIQGHTCYVKPFPISVEWPTRHDVVPDAVKDVRAQLLEELGIGQDVKTALGVDRLDYTKGILERLLAVERMLEKHPELVGKFTFIQISAPSRSQIVSYQNLEAELRDLASRINFRFHKPGEGEPPIVLRIAHHDSAEVFRYYRAADVCLVSSLHDGMNLVAKEYIASRSDCRGALVLSSFTGASRELHDALIVNPYDVEEMAAALYEGLTMSETEQRQRMSRMREIVGENNVYAWAGHFLGEVHRISELRDSSRAVS